MVNASNGEIDAILACVTQGDAASTPEEFNFWDDKFHRLIAGKLAGQPVGKSAHRVAQMTHNDRNPLGCGCLEPTDSGLTQLGRAAVREMNRIGILVDLAHSGMQTAADAFEYSTKPCIISHANARSVTDHPRNVTDEVLRMLASRGGVIGITAYAPFCQPKGGGHPSVEHVVDHICHVADLVGVDHVGIGSDQFEAESEVRYAAFATQFPTTQREFTREQVYAKGLERVDCLPRLTETLVARGFSDAETLKILGGNHLRLFREAWKS